MFNKCSSYEAERVCVNVPIKLLISLLLFVVLFVHLFVRRTHCGICDKLFSAEIVNCIILSRGQCCDALCVR